MTLAILQNRKDSIDKASLRDTDSLLAFVKMRDKERLIKIYNGKFPEDSIECTYNILLSNGRVLLIMSSPYSESGDWDLEYTHYFDADGRTFAYQKRANAFALPNDGVAYETTLDYFGPGLKRIRHSYKLVDQNDKPLGKEYAFDRGPAIDDKLYPTAVKCLKAYHIDLQNK